VSEDGEIRDTFRKLRYIFEMPEQVFFERYTDTDRQGTDSYLKLCLEHLENFRQKIPELPFSNPWVASKLAHRIPEGSTIHFGILNSLRSWNFFELPQSVCAASNVGGFGIDGNLSSLLGASLTNKNKLFFAVIGDLAFFYDMNSLGNRHFGNNVRILLVNNGKGTEFRHSSHFAGSFGEVADRFIAAGGHFGNKSPVLVKHYAEDLGLEYMSASNMQQFESVYERFLTPEHTGRSMLFEIFTDSSDETHALEIMTNLEESLKSKTKQFAKQMLGDKKFNALKKVIRR
jgi:2-succinyl-5-enolpyruvyl-6-hydroxy-3-cyclohexene-1-carboxylate synthase